MKKLNELTLKEKIGQMIGLAFAGVEYSDELKYQIEDIGAGLVIFFKDNCASIEQIYNLNKEIKHHAKIAPFIALDQEGGMVARVTEGVVQTPGAMPISAGSSVDDCYKLNYNMALELKAIGFNFNFAPDGDVNNNPLNPVINVRSYSENPLVVADYVEAAVKGMNDAKMMSSVKHFPGHGDTAVDSHLGLPVVEFDEKRLNSVELVPFKRCVEKDLPGIMVSHVMYKTIDADYPSSLSKKVINGLLRQKLGFKGLVVTDSLTMKAIWGRYSMEEIVIQGFNSGNDIMLLCGARDLASQKAFYETAVRCAKEGKISLKQIDESVERILKYKEIYEVEKPLDDFDTVKHSINKKECVEFAQSVADRSITLVKNENGLIPLKNKKTLVVFPLIKVVTLVENESGGLNNLSYYLSTKCDLMYYSLNPEIDEAERIINASKEYEQIIFCSYNACFNPNQASLINSLDKSKLIVAAIRTPYDIKVLDVPTYVMSYEASPQSFIALAKALEGKIAISGKSPVKLNN